MLRFSNSINSPVHKRSKFHKNTPWRGSQSMYLLDRVAKFQPTKSENSLEYFIDLSEFELFLFKCTWAGAAKSPTEIPQIIRPSKMIWWLWERPIMIHPETSGKMENNRENFLPYWFITSPDIKDPIGVAAEWMLAIQEPIS